MRFANFPNDEETAAEETEAADVPNAEKPVIWFNRQPSNSQTGELDMDALTWNDDTYYVGFDAIQGAVLQGEMIVEYLQSHGAELDRNGDGQTEGNIIDRLANPDAYEGFCINMVKTDNGASYMSKLS